MHDYQISTLICRVRHTHNEAGDLAITLKGEPEVQMSLRQCRALLRSLGNCVRAQEHYNDRREDRFVKVGGEG